MKIGFIIGFYPEKKGGAEYQSRLIADYLNNSNQIFFISIGHNNELVRYIDGIKVYCLCLKPSKFHQLTFYHFFSKKVIKS